MLMKSLLLAAGILAFLWLATPVAAIGISPGRIEMDFTPGFEADYSFSVINNVNSTQQVNVYASGDLAQYITMIDSGTVTMGPGEVRTFRFHIKLPATLEPGRRDTRLGATEVAPPGGMVAAVSGVEMQFWVNVPYPARYIAVDIRNSRPFPNKTVTFEITLSNPVSQSISATADLEILDMSNNTVDRFELGNAELAAGASKAFEANWTMPDHGYFKAVARAHFDAETTKKELVFGLEAPAEAAAPATAPTTKPAATANLLFSPYTFIIIIIVAAIIVVLLWPDKKGGEKNAQKA